MALAESLAGRVLAGRYRLNVKVNEGGMGAIWRAEHLILRAPVAVKLIDPALLERDHAVDRFLREAQAAASLRSPHVVQILDYGVDVDIPFIVMELLEGETLAERLRRRTRLTAEDAARVLSHVARAMARAHEAGIVHRDLKPENIFIVKNEDEELAKVLDFGVAKVNTNDISDKGAKTRTGSLLGTPYYMSPEQVQGTKEVDYRSDLWSLGVIAYECVTGERPFASNGLGDLILQICVGELPDPELVATVPPGFAAWFRRACERDPERRFQSARELLEELRRALGVEGRSASDSEPELPLVQAARPPPARPEHAATVVAVAPTLMDTSLEPRGRTPLPAIPEDSGRERSSLSAVYWVAAAALTAGVIGTLATLRSRATVSDEAAQVAPAFRAHAPPTEGSLPESDTLLEPARGSASQLAAAAGASAVAEEEVAASAEMNGTPPGGVAPGAGGASSLDPEAAGAEPAPSSESPPEPAYLPLSP